MIFLLSISAMATTYVVDAVDNLPNSDVEFILDAAGAENVVVSNDERNFFVADIDSSNALSLNPSIENIEPRILYIVEPNSSESTLDVSDTSGPNDPAWTSQWHMRDVDAQWIWNHTKAGEGVIVAVLDTGIAKTKDVREDHVVGRYNTTTDKTPIDGHGHGTHCAGTITQWTSNGIGAAGMAPNVSLMSVKVLSDAGFGYNDWIANGIYTAIDKGATVLSMSLGGSQSSSVINKAVDYAVEHGAIVVAAAGNDGTAKLGYPAGYGPVVAIGSYGPDHKRAYYSQYGKNLDLMAPGGNKQQKGGGVFQYTLFEGKESVQEWQGTSMATPHAAAAVAILLGEGVPANQVEDLLKKTARSRPTGTPENEYGSGLIDVKKAVETFRGKSDVALVENLNTLPHPSPAGWLTYAVMSLACLWSLTVSRFHNLSTKYTVATLVGSVISSGPLFFLSTFAVSLPGLAVLVVPWVEIPEYVLGAGSSGFPVWQSVVPLLLPTFFLVPLRTPLRGVIAGVAASFASYMVLNSVLSYNPVWWSSIFGASIWLAINALILFGSSIITANIEARDVIHHRD